MNHVTDFTDGVIKYTTSRGIGHHNSSQSLASFFYLEEEEEEEEENGEKNNIKCALKLETVVHSKKLCHKLVFLSSTISLPLRLTFCLKASLGTSPSLLIGISTILRPAIEALAGLVP